jgi:predicted amidohydrolase YtcJ
MRINYVKFSVTLVLLVNSTFLLAQSCQLIHSVNGYTPINQSAKLKQFNWLAFENGKVLATGTGKADKNFSHCTQIDGDNQYLLPGLIDAHGHIQGLGDEMQQVQLRDVSSEAEAINRVIQFAENNQSTRWILGRGWNQVLWLNKQFPTKKSLDQINTAKPIVLTRVDGHAAWVNSKALAIANITDATPDPAGGKIERDAMGKATGVLIDNAIDLVTMHIPSASMLEADSALDKAFDHLLSQGITSVHDAGVTPLTLKAYKQRLKENNLPLRVYAMLAGSHPMLMDWLNAGRFEHKSDRLNITSVKLYSDGALGSRGAALLAPYSDDIDNKGLLVTQPEQLDNLVETILAKGFQTNVHAIGDRGNQLVLNAFEKAYKKVGGKQLRNRIEHAQVVALADIPRFKTLDIIASMQPVHATSDKNMAGDRLGDERLKGAYAWQKFIQQETVIASGSDFPVELANPFHGLHAAVTRQDHNNQPQGGWLKGERMTPTQALFSFTLNAAFAAHQEKTLGSLETGKWADFILVDKDIINGNPRNIWQTKVIQTWVAGELKYQQD